jgi:hypothetical protein
VSAADRLVERHTPFRVLAGFVQPPRDQPEIGMVVRDAGHHVVGANGRRQAFGLAEGHRRLLDSACLSQEHARQPVDERQVALVARGVQRGGRLGQVFPEDARVANLPVAQRQLVVRQSDRPRVARQLREFERAGVEGDRARLVPLAEREPAVQPPQRRHRGVGQLFLERFRGAAQRQRGLAEVVGQQIALGEADANRDLVVPGKAARSVQGLEGLNGLQPAPALERRARAGQRGLHSRRGHSGSIQNGHYAPRHAGQSDTALARRSPILHA